MDPIRKRDKLLKKGDRIRLKVRLMSGWIGKATVTKDTFFDDDSVDFIKDGYNPEEYPHDSYGSARRHEVVVLRLQGGNDVH